MGRARHRRRVPRSRGRGTVTISEAAQRNHDALFPGHVSTLKVTDPELIEVFDNFAFDEVLEYGDLDRRTRLMVQLAAIIASQAVNEYRRCRRRADHRCHADRGEGNRLPGRPLYRAGQGLRLPARHQRGTHRARRRTPVVASVVIDAADACRGRLGGAKQIVGADKVEACMRPPPTTTAHFQRYLSANCFGDYVARARHRPADPGTPDVLDAGRTWRRRRSSEGTRRRQPQRRQRPRPPSSRF